MKKALKDFFTFEKRGQKGLMVLIIVLSTQLLILWALYFYNPIKAIEPNLILVDTNLLDSLQKQDQPFVETKADEAFNDDVVSFQSYKKENKRFNFNPNTITNEEWLSLGLSAKQVKIIRKYLDKGGSFKTPTDVLKIKYVNETLWNELIPYIVIEEPKAEEIKRYTNTKDTSAAALAEKAKEKAEKLNFYYC